MIVAFIKKHILLLLLILLSLPAVYMLMHPGFFVSDDGEWMIIRLSAFYETFRSGELPVRFIARLNNGYGYPLGNFMYPGFLYLGSIIHLFGFGFTSTIKIIFGLSMLFSGIFTFFWLQRLVSRYAAFFAALFYLYMPYHVFDLYSRGSLGEILALCVIPFVLWQMERRDLVFSSVGVGCLVLAHNTVAFLFVIPLYLYWFLCTKESVIKKSISSAMPLLFGMLLAAFFWIPALYDLQFTIFRSVVISDWQQYFASISLIGVSTLLVVTSSVVVLFLKEKRQVPSYTLHLFFLGLALISLILSVSVSTPFWKIIPVSVIQFPFRMLTLYIPAVTFLFASLLQVFSIKKQVVIGSIIIFLTMLLSSTYYLQVETFDKGDAYYMSNFSTTTTKDEYMPIWVKKPLPGLASKKIEVIDGKSIVSNEQIHPNKVTFTLTGNEKSLIQINTVYFPGWIVLVDSKKKDIFIEKEYGLIQFLLPSGTHTVEVKFSETPIRIFANCLSLVTAGILGIMLFTKLRYNAVKLKKKNG